MIYTRPSCAFRKDYLHDRPANRQRMRMGCIHDGHVNYIREFYLHDRPANRQRMRMEYIHDGRVNYIREFYLHDRPANRQCMRMEYIHDGRVNYIRELYYTTVTCGIVSTHGWGLPTGACVESKICSLCT